MNKYTEKEYSKQFDFELWKKLYHYAQSYKKELFILAVVMVGVAGIDVVFPVMTKYAIDNFIVTSKLNGLKQFAFIYAGLVILQSINIWVFINQAGKIEMGISYDIRKKGFEKLQELSLSFFDKTPVGWLMARMISDIRRLSQTISWGLVDSVWGLTMMMGIMFVMFYFNWKLALITLSVVPLLIAISIIFQKKILKAYRKVRKTNSKITGAFNEGIMGARTTKILVREVESLNEFKELTVKRQIN
ncbi:MAG: ABC transporter transmembrane domain-containing protein [Halothermotrichaceae bacterium]